MKFFSRKSSTKGKIDQPSRVNKLYDKNDTINILSSSFSRLSYASSRSSTNANNANNNAPNNGTSVDDNNRKGKKGLRDGRTKADDDDAGGKGEKENNTGRESRSSRPPVTGLQRGSDRNSNNTFTALPFSNTTFTTRLRSYTLRTLGSGTTLYTACKLPRGETCGAWVVVNLVDFLTDVSSIYDVIRPSTLPPIGTGFPGGVEYKWSTTTGEVRRVSGPEYCNLVLEWASVQLNDESLFPNEDDEELCNSIWNSKGFAKVVGNIFKRIFRVYACVYTGYFETLKSVDLSKELNSCFKHFMYFSFEFQLIQESEMAPLDVLVRPIREQHKKAEFEFKRKIENKPQGRY